MTEGSSTVYGYPPSPDPNPQLRVQEHDPLLWLSEYFAHGDTPETLERRGCLLKLMSMNLYDMEANSRTENLAAFKRAYGGSLEAMTRCLEKFFPDMSAQDIRGFIYCFYPFLFGVYPYTAVTPKQREAMALAGVRRPRLSVRTLVEDFTARLLG